MATPGKVIYESSEFLALAMDGYVHSTAKGSSPLDETEKAAHATMIYMRSHDCHRLLFDVSGMSWLNDLRGRLRRTELAAEARDVLERVAFVSPNSAVRYLVKVIVRGGGIPHVEAFTDIDGAREWLLSDRP